MVKILDVENTLLNKFVAQLRNTDFHSDSMRFRINLKRIAQIMAYEISHTLRYEEETVQTPLGEANIHLPIDKPVLVSILRSGIPMHEGFVSFFDDSDSAFVSAYRHYSEDGSFNVDVDYVATPDLNDKELIIIDPIIATGESSYLVYKALLENGGIPRRTHFASVIASREGVDYLKKKTRGQDTNIWICSMDEELTVKSYIVPGMGDPGDLAYGDKKF